jgi:glycosyltransferase involved in cell wall biosynthesis
MKILLLTQYFPPEFGAASARNSEHARLWVEAGADVEICTGFPNYPSGIVPPEYKGVRFRRETIHGYTILRSWIYATPNRAVWKRALASLSFMVSAAMTGAFRCHKPDVIIASSGPFFIGPLGYMLSRIKRVPFVFEVRDILPQQAIDTGMLRNPWLIRLLIGTEEFLYRRARRVVAVSEASRQELAERGVDEAKLVTIENGISESLFTPESKDNAVRREYGWQDKYVAMYVGVHGVSQGLQTLLEAAESLQAEEDIHFVLVGDGAEKNALQQWATDRQLTNVEFLPVQPRERVAQFYAAADVCFAPLRKGNYFTINIPSKILEIMACGRPVILGAEGQAQRIIEEAGSGLVVSPEDAQAYAQAVLALRASPDMAEELGSRGHGFVLEHFTRERKADRYLEILRDAISTPRHDLPHSRSLT